MFRGLRSQIIISVSFEESFPPNFTCLVQVVMMVCKKQGLALSVAVVKMVCKKLGLAL